MRGGFSMRRHPPGKAKRAPETRAQLLEEWVHRLEERDLLFHVLAGYECARIYGDYCPPIHLQQLKKALVNRDEAKRVEQFLEQFPARKISMKRLEEASRAIRRRTHEETLAAALHLPKISCACAATGAIISRWWRGWSASIWCARNTPASFRA